jgi:uncharacterized protein
MSHSDPDALPGKAEGHDEQVVAQPLETNPPVANTECWRCGKEFSLTDSRCPFCLARNEHAPLDSTTNDRSDSRETERPLSIAMWTYAITLGVSLLFGGIAHLTVAGKTEIDLQLATSLAYQMLFLEGIDTIVIIVGMILCGRVALRRATKRSGVMASWVFALPLLAVMLGVNMAYHAAILKITGVPEVEDELLKYPQLLNLMIVMVCFQPAIVEELFMRHFFLSVLSRHMSIHGAVWVSAVAFGLWHLAVPLSIPYLILMGGVLGYLRISSGCILLPILFHFAHNAAIVAIEVNS